MQVLHLIVGKNVHAKLAPDRLLFKTAFFTFLSDPVIESNTYSTPANR